MHGDGGPARSVAALFTLEHRDCQPEDLRVGEMASVSEFAASESGKFDFALRRPPVCYSGKKGGERSNCGSRVLQAVSNTLNNFTSEEHARVYQH